MHTYLCLCRVKPVHPPGYVLEDWRSATVIHEHAGVLRHEGEGEVLARTYGPVVDVPRDLRGVKVYGVAHDVPVDQRDGDVLALSDPDERPGQSPVVGPRVICDVGSHLDFLHHGDQRE